MRWPWTKPRQFYVAVCYPRTGIVLGFFTDMAMYATAVHLAEADLKAGRITHWKCGEVE